MSSPTRPSTDRRPHRHQSLASTPPRPRQSQERSPPIECGAAPRQTEKSPEMRTARAAWRQPAPPILPECQVTGPETRCQDKSHAASPRQWRLPAAFANCPGFLVLVFHVLVFHVLMFLALMFVAFGVGAPATPSPPASAPQTTARQWKIAGAKRQKALHRSPQFCR